MLTTTSSTFVSCCFMAHTFLRILMTASRSKNVGLVILSIILFNLIMWHMTTWLSVSVSDNRPRIKNKYKNKILLSVIIPTYEFDDSKLRRAIQSVASQTSRPPLVNFVFQSEIIVVNDGSSEQHFKSFSEECKAKFPVSKGERLEGYDCRAGVHFVRFVSNSINEGLGGARNFGIKQSRAKWVLPLDADDELQPNFFSEVIISLYMKSPNLTLHNPGRYNVIMPGMADFRGKPLLWQPSQNTSNIKQANVFHCCGMYLKAIHDAGIVYDKMMVFGWEDWDFWIKLQDQIGINALMVQKPLYKYNIGEDKGEGSSHLSKFCVTHREVCVAHLHLNNPCLYAKGDVVKSYEIVREYLWRTGPVPKWKLVNREAEHGDQFAQLIVNTTATSSSSTSMRLMMDYHESQCIIPRAQCKAAVGLLSDLADKQENSKNMTMFHIIITKVSADKLWRQMLRHVVVGILDFNPLATLLIHSDLKLSDIFDRVFVGYFNSRLLLSPLHCHSEIAAEHGMTEVGEYINRRGNGRPNYYSHFTDYLRFLLLYSFGGVYMDTDILLRQSVSHLHNYAAQEDDLYVNGAFLSFDRYSPVMKYCLLQIPVVYEPFVWNTIGPDLITKASKIKTTDVDRWQFNVLDREAFYDVNWDNLAGLVSTNYSHDAYKSRGDSNLGYHFWGKVFYAQQAQRNQPGQAHTQTRHGRRKGGVAANSLLGWALLDTCRQGIMACVPLVPS